MLKIAYETNCRGKVAAASLRQFYEDAFIFLQSEAEDQEQNSEKVQTNLIKFMLMHADREAYEYRNWRQVMQIMDTCVIVITSFHSKQ